MELETINKLYLELSQITTATTTREILLQKQLAEARRDSARLKNDAAIFYEAASGLLATNDALRAQLAEAQRELQNCKYGRAISVDDFIVTFRCEDKGIVGKTDAKIHSVSQHDDGVIEVVIDHWP